MGKWIGVDLDGTLAYYDDWIGIETIGEPIMPMVERVKDWLNQGIEVKIVTARVFPVPGRDLEATKAYIYAWCLKNIGKMLPIVANKDLDMIVLWDDRCVQVEKNTGRLIGDPNAIY